MYRKATVAAVCFTALAAVTGCLNSNDDTAQPDGRSEQQADDAAQQVPELTVASSEFGDIVVDEDGLTLYRFDKDTANPPKSNCHDDCAEAWPPLIADDLEVDGIDESLVGTVERADGSEQVTLAGWPLYYYAQDTRAGDVKGQGVDDVWFAATPEGKKALADATKPTPSAPGKNNYSGGYNYDSGSSGSSGSGYSY